MIVDDDDEPIRYAVQLSTRAEVDFAQARLYVLAKAGEKAADDWEEGIDEVIASLRVNPYRSPVPEVLLFPTAKISQTTYRRRGSSFSHRLLWVILEKGRDIRSVLVLYIRHSSQDDITRIEADDIAEQARLLDLPEGFTE